MWSLSVGYLLLKVLSAATLQSIFCFVGTCVSLLKDTHTWTCSNSALWHHANCSNRLQGFCDSFCAGRGCAIEPPEMHSSFAEQLMSMAITAFPFLSLLWRQISKQSLLVKNNPRSLKLNQCPQASIDLKSTFCTLILLVPLPTMNLQQ